MTARLDSTILTLRETHQVAVAENRSHCLSLMQSYRKIINSIPKEPINYKSIDSLCSYLKLSTNKVHQITFDIKELDYIPKTPINSPIPFKNLSRPKGPLIPSEYSVLDRLNLDPPLLRGPKLRTTQEDYLELIEPKTSLEYCAQNTALTKLAAKVIWSLSYITTPIQYLQRLAVNPWFSKQMITIPKDTRKHMEYVICGGQIKSQMLGQTLQGSLSVVSKTKFKEYDLALKSPKSSINYIIDESVILMVLDSLQNPHIIHAVAISDKGIFLPYADCSLITLIKTNAINDPKIIKRLLLGVSSGLLALHEKGLTHKDVKPNNILIINHEAVLCDFGLTCVTEGDDVKGGTEKYAAPECLTDKTVALTNKVDSWSFGACVLTIIYGSGILIQDPKQNQQYSLGRFLLNSESANLNKQLESLKTNPILKQRDPDESFLKIAQSCLNKNPEDRLDMKTIIAKLESIYL